jgi:metal-responsive CopG/Arc/MetJ family transcriptional regulator
MASKRAAGAYARLNITLPRATVGLLDRLTSKGNRSRFIDEAIRERIASVGRARLRRELERGYVARAARDRRMVDEWFPIDEELYEPAVRPARTRVGAPRGVGLVEI